MNTITGRKAAAFAAALLAFAAVNAEEKVIYSETFEETIPGQTPKEWRTVWGNPGGDTVTVSNEKSRGGDNALMLDRTSNQGQWGFGFRFPKVEKGTIALEYDFLLDGPGNQAVLGFELRDNVTGRSVLSAFTVQNFRIRDSKRKPLMELARDTWYHVKFTLPLTEADGKEKKIEVTDPKSGKTAELVSPVTAYPSNPGTLSINTHPGKNNFRAFFDNVKVSVAD